MTFQLVFGSGNQLSGWKKSLRGTISYIQCYNLILVQLQGRHPFWDTKLFTRNF